MKKLGIGIIGCGNISTAYLKLAPLFKGLEVRAVADINMEAATARAAEFNVKAQSVDDLLANPALDIVINLTIPDAHYPITKRILEAGKHAYSEKPLVLTLEQGTTLRDLAKAKGLSVGCAPDTFLGGAHQQARAILDEGTIGEITTGNAAIQAHAAEWIVHVSGVARDGDAPLHIMGRHPFMHAIGCAMNDLVGGGPFGGAL